MLLQMEDRRDLVGAHGLDQLGSTATSSSFSTTPTHRLRHTPTTDFQPPYFPPPYSVPQQTMDFAHHHVNPDPYSHINHYNNPHHQGYGVNPSDRHHLLGGNDPLSNSLAPRGFPSSYDTRRPDYGINRPEVLIAPRGPHELHDPSLLGIQGHGLGLEDGGQKSWWPCESPSQVFFAYTGSSGRSKIHGIDDTNNYMSSEHNSVIKRAGIRKPDQKDIVISGVTSPSDVFVSVPGRLSLLSSTSKYKVTVAEVQRRLSPPECLNASLLGGVLRRAKSKNGGRSLRDKLEKIGLSLPAGRRKAATVTLLTSLVEGEAVRLARDFGYLCETEFPSRQTAEYVARQHSDPSEQQTRKNMILAAKSIIKELVDLLNQDRTPLGNTRPQIILEPNIQRHLSHFSLITHGFGSPALVAAFTAMQNYLTEMLKYIEKNYPATQGGGSLSGGLDSKTKSEDKDIRK